MEDPDIEGKGILKWFLEIGHKHMKYLRIETKGGLLWTQSQTTSFNNRKFLEDVNNYQILNVYQGHS
jgi:hypothetical protein